MAPGWGKINQAVKEQYLAQISNTGKREGRKEKINMRLESVRFPFDPSVREKLSDDDLAKGVKLKFMAEIDFKCFSKVVKWSFFAQQTLYNGVTTFMKLQAFLDLRKKMRKQKPRKSRLLSTTNEEENKIES